VPQDVADKLLQHHIWEMNPVREAIDAAILASAWEYQGKVEDFIK